MLRTQRKSPAAPPTERMAACRARRVTGVADDALMLRHNRALAVFRGLV